MLGQFHLITEAGVDAVDKAGLAFGAEAGFSPGAEALGR